MKKQLFLWSFLLFFVGFTNALVPSTVLKPGDIAIVQVNYSYNSFDFVSFVDIAAGTKIRFTDYVYSSTLSDLDQTTTSDGIYEFTASAAIAAGTVIQYKINSTQNAAFSTIAGSSLSMRSYRNNYALYGENLIAYQDNGAVKTYLFAIGWMRANNFGTNPYNQSAKVCDIPSGLSKDNFTVVQIDSVLKPGQSGQLARDFRYNKYDGFNATAYMVRRWLTNTSNFNTYSGSMNNDPVDNFTVLAPDNVAPVISSIYPENNMLNVSVNAGIELIFNEPVEVRKAMLIKNSSTQSTIIATKDEFSVSDAVVSYAFDGHLDNATNYTLEIAANTITDLNGNGWPAKDSIIHFVTSAEKSVISIDFKAAKHNLRWTTQSTVEDFEGYYLLGYWSFEIENIPMRWYVNEHGETATSIPAFPSYGSEMFIGGMNNSRLVVNVSALNNTITNISSNVYENNCQITTSVYGGANILKSTIVKNSNASPFSIDEQHYVKQYFSNKNAVKVDSVVYASLEGRVFNTKIELIDLNAPNVELGADRVICEGDSVVFDAGYTPGALYIWNTNETTQKIVAKTSGNYSVRVKNTLGERSDNVQLTVKPKVQLSLPDTIIACVGDTITLTAGNNPEFSYLWSYQNATTSSIKVTESGVYYVVGSSGPGGCLATDSCRVIFNGAKVHAFHYQGGIYGSGDVNALLYRRNDDGKFVLYDTKEMLQAVNYENLPEGKYILKAHFVNYSFSGENPWMDTYHDGNTEWTKVLPFNLTCSTDTMISFLLASKPYFEFTGTASISGTIYVTNQGQKVQMKVRSITVDDCMTHVLLFDTNGNLIASICPDANGNFSFTNLPAGNYSVSIERTGFEIQSLFTTSLSAGSSVTNANFTINYENQSIVQGTTTSLQQVSTNLNLNVWPNPAVNAVTLSFDLQYAGKVKIDVINIGGGNVYSETLNCESGRQVKNLSLNENPGVYIVQIKGTGYSSKARLILK